MIYLLSLLLIRIYSHCPLTHPFALDKGQSCCSIGSNVTVDESVCKGESIPCPHVNCNTVENVDKCATGVHQCDQHADCEPIPEGRYRCWCHDGYNNTNYQYPRCIDRSNCSPLYYEDDTLFNCTDMDECRNPDLNQCSEYASCLQTPGSYSCACNIGFTDNSPSFSSGIQCDCSGTESSINDDNECIPFKVLTIGRIAFFHLVRDIQSNIQLDDPRTYRRYRIPEVRQHWPYRILDIRPLEDLDIQSITSNDQGYLVIGEIIIFSLNGPDVLFENLGEMLYDVNGLTETLFTDYDDHFYPLLMDLQLLTQVPYVTDTGELFYPYDPIPPHKLDDCNNDEAACNLYFTDPQVNGLMIVLIPNLIICIIFNLFGLLKIKNRYQKKHINDIMPVTEEDFGFLAKITNPKIRMSIYELVQFLPAAMIVIIDAVDVIFDTKYFYDLKSSGGPPTGVVNEYLHIPRVAFEVMFGCLMMTIG